MSTVKTFVEEFANKKIQNTQLNPNAVSDYLKERLEIKTYIPFAEKRELCERVINASNTRNKNGIIEVDSVTRYIIFTLSVITAYTNLEFSSGEDVEFDSLDEYDMLCQNGLLNPILGVIGEEYAACNNMLNMMMEDVVANNNTIENILGNASNALFLSLDTLIDALANKIDELELDLSQIDIDKYSWIKKLLSNK